MLGKGLASLKRRANKSQLVIKKSMSCLIHAPLQVMKAMSLFIKHSCAAFDLNIKVSRSSLHHKVNVKKRNTYQPTNMTVI